MNQSELSKAEKKYNNLLYKSGQLVGKIEIFIKSLNSSGMVSKTKLKASQNYTTKQLMTNDAKDIRKEYLRRVEEIKKSNEEDSRGFNKEIETEIDNLIKNIKKGS
jgi:hypothetical protein